MLPGSGWPKSVTSVKVGMGSEKRWETSIVHSKPLLSNPERGRPAKKSSPNECRNVVSVPLARLAPECCSVSNSEPKHHVQDSAFCRCHKEENRRDAMTDDDAFSVSSVT